MPRHVGVALLLTALATVACSGPPGAGPTDVPSTPTSTPTQALPDAQRWFAHRAEAHRQGVSNLRPFYDPDVELDHLAWGEGESLHGRAAALEYLAEQWRPRTWNRTSLLPVYVTTSGALTVEQIEEQASNRITDAMFLHTMSDAGIVSEVYAPSMAVWRVRTRRSAEDHRAAVASALAAQYIAAWASGDPAAVRTLYSPRAAVTDSVLSVGARGADEIARLAGASDVEGGLASATAKPLSDRDPASVFAAGWLEGGEPIELIAVLLHVEGASCARDIAVVLRLDAKGRILTEERAHRVDELLRCSDGSSLPAGWWQSVRVPESVSVSQTGTLRLAGADVAVYNGSPGLDSLIVWAFGRFTGAGLEPPAISGVTFQAQDVDMCRAVSGQILGGEITLCFQELAACADQECGQWHAFAKSTLLHELGHAWIDENVDESGRDRFLDLSGMATWADHHQRWQDRGAEVAATALAFGLMDEPFPLRNGLATCEELAEYFEALTGAPFADDTPCTVPGPDAGTLAQ